MKTKKLYILLFLLILITKAQATGTSAQTTSPSIVIRDVSISNLSTVIGDSDSETFTLSGLHLLSNVSLSLSGDNANQFSLSESSISQNSGSIANTYATINYTPTSVGNHVAILSISTSGFTTIDRTINGSCTLATALKNNESLLLLSKVNGNIVFTANKGELLKVYNAVGECLLSNQTLEGVNVITAPTSGFLVVKVGSKSARIIL
jgi:hypothetical protein